LDEVGRSGCWGCSNWKLGLETLPPNWAGRTGVRFGCPWWLEPPGGNLSPLGCCFEGFGLEDLSGWNTPVPGTFFPVFGGGWDWGGYGCGYGYRCGCGCPWMRSALRGVGSVSKSVVLNC
jgi:hypothetical protein